MSQYGVTAIDMPFVRGGIDHAGRAVSMYDGSARELIEAIVTGYLPEFAIHPDALMKLLRPNLDHLGKAANVAPPVAALRAS